MRRFCGDLFGVLVTVLLTSLVLCACAVAREFEMTKFDVHTTFSQETPGELTGASGYRNIEEPYAFSQAGGHPIALTTTIEFKKQVIHTSSGGIGEIPAGGDPKDIQVELPPGLLADPLSGPRCPLAVFTRQGARNCPAATQIGFVELFFAATVIDADIYNLVPEAGQSAEFGIPPGGSINVILTAHLVHTAEGYGFTVVSNNIPQRGFTRLKLSFWGTPADSAHTPQRGRACGGNPFAGFPTCANGVLTSLGGEAAGVEPVPFLVMPTDCADGPEKVRVLYDSWQEPGLFYEGPASELPQSTGCGALSFQPELEVRPDTKQADAPVGLNVNLKVPQPEEPGVPRTPDLRNAVVTLPPGLSINPSVVDGVQACNETGPEGIDLRTDLNHKQEPLKPGELDEGEKFGPNGEPQLEAGHCPEASVVGTAEAVTPLLPEPIKGHLYLARPLCGGAGQAGCVEEDARDGRLYRLYMELGGEGALANTGINIKLAGTVSADLATGQISSSFVNNPQAPFSELRLHLNGGPRAELANPQSCGQARTTSDFTPWSATGTFEGKLIQGTPDANPVSFFDVTGCSATEGFAPSFSAGTVTSEAGIFTPFTMTLSRKDGEQDIAGIQVHTPAGLLGMLANVPLCPEDQANDPARYGECDASKIGTTMVASGAGSHPFEISGDVYLTGPYEGAPFGLSIVTHAVAGPFNLGLVVVRARINVDPATSELTVTTDETGPYKVPQIVFGVPLRLKRITVNIDRPNFMFNPTNCNRLQVSANVSGSLNTLAHVSSPFAVGGCKGLAFAPSFKVSTSAHTSKAGGASLDAKVSFPPSTPGTEANIGYVKVELPKQMPSRLTTLQKACTAAVFDADPAGCPAASIIGIARASTPLLPVGLSGPVYFVSNGGEAFPDLVVVLQGDGVRVDLTGNTFISKTGVTSSTFKTIPDVPVNTFELYLPQGPNSALAANTNLCTASAGTRVLKRKITKHIHGHTVHQTLTKTVKSSGLVMPTEFVAQNGAVMKQNTKITVTGCAKNAKAAAKSAKTARKARKANTKRRASK